MSLDFLNSLDKNNQKKKYQKYLIEMGIEKATVLVPFEHIQTFEKQIELTRPSSINKLKNILKEHNGIIEE